MTDRPVNTDMPMTAAMCHERHGHLGDLIVRVEAKIDTVIEQQRVTNGNVAKLQIWRAWMSGAMAAIAALIPFVTAALLKWVFG